MDILDAIRQHTKIVSSDSHRGCPEHDGRPGCLRARFGSAAASSDRFKVLLDNIGTDKKVLVRLAMTLHTWSRIMMRSISSSRHLRSLQYLD